MSLAPLQLANSQENWLLVFDAEHYIFITHSIIFIKDIKNQTFNVEFGLQPSLELPSVDSARTLY